MKWVCDFAEGSREMRDLLGGKGANLAEMATVLGSDLVPAGFTITTEACVAYMKAAGELQADLDDEVDAALSALEERVGRRFGDADDPLLVSDRSGSGVAFTRDERTGEPTPSGDFLINAQGEDVVAGIRNTQDLHALADLMPEAYGRLREVLTTLERHYRDIQDVEFTIEEERLYLLQTRNAKRP